MIGRWLQGSSFIMLFIHQHDISNHHDNQQQHNDHRQHPKQDQALLASLK